MTDASLWQSISCARLNLAHVLAEPKLGVFDGQAACFRMGGEVPVPVPAGLGRTDYQSEPFGLELKCVASIIEKDRIRLEFESENSVLFLASGTNIHGTIVPGREEQRIHTTVEMRAGQTFVMSHALPCEPAYDSTASMLFRPSNFGESNLVVLVTPEFMCPMDSAETAPAAKSKKVAELMAKFHAAYKEGKYVEAEACAAQVLKLDQDNVAAAAAIKMARVSSCRQMPSISCSSATPTPTYMKLSLEDLLSMPTTVKFANATLEQLVDDLRAQYGINIEFDKQAIEKCGIHLTRPFLSCNLEQVSLKSVLNFLLRQSGLTYVIKDEVVIVTTENAAKGKQITKCYSVTDLITPIVDRTKDPREKKEETPEKSLMKLIVNTVAPASWSDMGGCATMEYYPLGNTLVINQTPEVHEQISDLLAFLQAHVTYVCKDYVPLGCLPFDTPETDQASGHREGAESGQGKLAADPKNAFVPFGEVVVNLNEARLTRYLRVKLILVVDIQQEKPITELVQKNKPILKNWLLTYLSDQSLKEVRGDSGNQSSPNARFKINSTACSSRTAPNESATCSSKSSWCSKQWARLRKAISGTADQSPEGFAYVRLLSVQSILGLAHSGRPSEFACGQATWAACL